MNKVNQTEISQEEIYERVKAIIVKLYDVDGSEVHLFVPLLHQFCVPRQQKSRPVRPDQAMFFRKCLQFLKVHNFLLSDFCPQVFDFPCGILVFRDKQ